MCMHPRHQHAEHSPPPPQGMQLLFASSLATATPVSPTNPGIAATPQDPELEFDQEVYPVGVSVAEVAIVGITQRTVRSKTSWGDGTELPCFHPLPESQPVLPCLLRRLLQQVACFVPLSLSAIVIEYHWHIVVTGQVARGVDAGPCTQPSPSLCSFHGVAPVHDPGNGCRAFYASHVQTVRVGRNGQL